jgi:hypothetical protein
LRRFDRSEPVTLEKSGEFSVIFEIERFDEEGIRTEFVSAVDIGSEIGGSKDDDGNGTNARLLTYPDENVIAVGAREFKIEQDKVWKGMLGAIGVRAGAAQIIDGLLTAADDIERVGHGGFLKGPANKQDVIFKVFNQQNDGMIIHRQLPASGSAGSGDMGYEPHYPKFE